jgi:ABC-type amino acid transport substrate-binding protein
VGVLRVCLGEADLPRSQAAPVQGFDLEVAQLVADGLNRELQPVWLAKPNPTEIESTDIDYGPLLTGRCDLQLSIPGLGALGGYAQHLALTEPYYGAGFELVPGNVDIDLEAPDERRIAVQNNTVAHVYIDKLGFDWTMRGDSDKIVAAIDSGEAGAGLVWGPELALLEIDYNPRFQAPAALRWNHHGATRSADLDLREAIDAVLARGDVRDGIHSLLRQHGIPPHRPFTSTHQAGMLVE